MSDFKDFVPEGSDPGALGGGFTDFVPPRIPVITTDDVETSETLTCEVCGFVAGSRAGLSSHVRSHKETE